MSSGESSKLSIAVVCYDTPVSQLGTLFSSLAVSLDFLHQHDSSFFTEVILVDNSSQPVSDLRDLVSASELGDPVKYPVRIHSGQGNIGFGRAHNLAMADLDSDYHLILNPDVVLDSSALVEGLKYFQSSAEAVLLSPYAEDEQGKRQYLCKRYPSVLLFLLRGFFPGFIKSLFAKSLAKFELRELNDDGPSKGIPIASGAFMLCRSDALLSVNGFDPGYFLYFEDFDLSLRLARLGDIVYLPSMKIVHHGGNSARKGWQHVRMFLRSGIRFFNSHGWRLV